MVVADAVLDLLESLEWSGTKYYDAVCCPSCRGLAPSESTFAAMSREPIGHTEDCDLYRVLREHGRKPQYTG